MATDKKPLPAPDSEAYRTAAMWFQMALNESPIAGVERERLERIVEELNAKSALQQDCEALMAEGQVALTEERLEAYLQHHMEHELKNFINLFSITDFAVAVEVTVDEAVCLDEEDQ